jgi:putative Ca2+/H+ antiporter (TMEM165/GDT1 family)
MTDKEMVELLLKHADFAWRSYSERRAIEWKVNFGLWTALGVFAGFVFQLNTETLPIQYGYIASGILFIIFPVFIWWKYEIQKRNTRDHKAMYYYWEIAHNELANLKNKLVDLKTAPHFKDDKPKFSGWRITHLSQIIITGLFVFLAIFAMFTRTFEMNIPSAKEVTVKSDELVVSLSNSRKITIPLKEYPELLAAFRAGRLNWALIDDGQKIRLSGTNQEDFIVADLLTGKP